MNVDTTIARTLLPTGGLSFPLLLILFLVRLLLAPPASAQQPELRVGLLAHSTGPISSGIESGTDLNLELLFAPYGDVPLWLGRTAVGASINNRGDTSQLYLGQAWLVPLAWALEFEYLFSLSIHDGHLDDGDKEHRQLGSRVFFRQGFELGYRFETFRLSAFYSHASHLGLLASRNQGLDNLGVRVALPF